MPVGSMSKDFVAKIGQALEDAGRRGIHVTPGAGTCDLEAQQFAHRPAEDVEDGPPPGRPFHLEDPPGPRDIGEPDGTSKLCYFLDGVQSSREIGRIEMPRVMVAPGAAAFATRCDRRFTRMPLEEPPTVV